MKEYEFTFKYQLPEANDKPERHLAALEAEGCDDATIGIGQAGRIALAFTREADSANAAIVSALKSIKKAIPGARLIEVEPDFVGLTDVADLLNFSRQNMRKVMINGGSQFPPPVYQGKSPVWHLASILEWLKENKAYDINDAVLDIAKAAMQLNLINMLPKINAAFRNEINAALNSD